MDFARGEKKKKPAEAVVGFIGWLEVMNAVVHKLLLFPSVAAHAAGHGEWREPSAGCLIVFVPKLWWRVRRNNVPSCAQKYPTSYYKYKSHYSTDSYLLAIPPVVQRSCMSLPWFKRSDTILHPRPRHLTASAPKLPGKTWGAVDAAVSASAFATRNIGPTASALEHEHGNLTGKGEIKARVQS